MENLINLHCQSSVTSIKPEQLNECMSKIPSWNINGDKTAITKRYEFKNFKQTMFFINALAYICEQECHHPDAKFGFNYCEVLFTTHDVAGLSMNDIICAAKVDNLLTK